MYFKELQQFILKAGKQPVSDSGDKAQSVLYKWTSAQRTEYRNERLNPERTALLETLAGWTWNPQTDQDVWLCKYEQAKEYMRVNSKVPTAGPLGKWAGHQREQYAQKRMPADRLVLINALGSAWYWNTKEKMLGR